MLHRILGAALIVCGLVAVVLGVASATVWRTSPTVTATTPHASADDSTSTLVTTGPGVLDLVDPDVHVTATSPSGGDVVIAVGSPTDVAGWVGKDPLVTVDGLSTWQTLKTTTSGGTAPDKAPDPSISDMWTQVVQGSGSASLALSDVPAGTTLLVAGVGVGDDAAQPTLALTWDRTVTTPYLWPLVLVGLLLVVVGAVVLVIGRSRARSRRASAVRAAARSTEDASSLGADPARPMTRRELREQTEQQSRAGKPGRGRAAAPPSPPVEAPAETVAIQIPEETRGAADAWRRRWNVPARIEPAGEPTGTPVVGQPSESSDATTVEGSPSGRTAARHGAPTTAPRVGAAAAMPAARPAPTAVWSPLRSEPQPWGRPDDAPRDDDASQHDDDAPQDGGRR